MKKRLTRIISNGIRNRFNDAKDIMTAENKIRSPSDFVGVYGYSLISGIAVSSVCCLCDSYFEINSLLEFVSDNDLIKYSTGAYFLGASNYIIKCERDELKINR